MSKDPLFKWRKLNNTAFPKHLNIVYGKTFYWKKSIFLSPSEQAWNDYIEELTSHSTIGTMNLQQKLLLSKQ